MYTSTHQVLTQVRAAYIQVCVGLVMLRDRAMHEASKDLPTDDGNEKPAIASTADDNVSLPTQALDLQSGQHHAAAVAHLQQLRMPKVQSASHRPPLRTKGEGPAAGSSAWNSRSRGRPVEPEAPRGVPLNAADAPQPFGEMGCCFSDPVSAVPVSSSNSSNDFPIGPSAGAFEMGQGHAVFPPAVWDAGPHIRVGGGSAGLGLFTGLDSTPFAPQLPGPLQPPLLNFNEAGLAGGGANWVGGFFGHEFEGRPGDVPRQQILTMPCDPAVTHAQPATVMDLTPPAPMRHMLGSQADGSNVQVAPPLKTEALDDDGIDIAFPFPPHLPAPDFPLEN